MKAITTLCLFCLLAFQSVSARLPDITKQELVNKIRSEENKIQAFQVKYRYTQGQYEQTESVEKQIIPELTIDMEYAHDIVKGYRYLHEKWLNRPDGQEFENKYAYDSKTGTRLVLKLPDDQNRMYGYITNTIPDKFNDEACWKTEWSTYGFVDTNDTVSVVIENDENAQVTIEELNGQQVYKVSFSIPGEDLEFTHPETGEKHTFKTHNDYIAWLLPEKNYQPVKIIRLLVDDPNNFYTCLASDFREVEPGIWLPYRLERPPRETGHRRGRIIEVKSITLNEKASVISRLEFPNETLVEDEVAGVEYKAYNEK